MRITRLSSVVLIGLALAACGSSTGTGGTGGTAGGGAGGDAGQGGGGEGGAAGGAGGAGGSGAAGGQAGGGQGGTGGGCADIDCALACPEGLWKDAMGCDTCACAPPAPAFEVDLASYPVVASDLTTIASKYIGGIDRWVLDFKWYYDGGVDNGHEVKATLRVQDLPQYPITTDNQTWLLPEDEGMPLEGQTAVYTLFGFGVISGDLAPVKGFLSIRVNGANFEGGVSLDLDPVTGFPGGPVHVAGPFSVPIP